MNTLITPLQTIALAFNDGEYVAPSTVSDSDIAAAMHRYVEPVIGRRLAEALAEGRYEALKEEYVAPALAMSVRTLIQRSLNVRTGQAGLSIPTGRGSDTALKSASDELQRSLRHRRRALLRRLSDYLAAHAEEFPEYRPEEDAMKKCSIDGGFVQVY